MNARQPNICDRSGVSNSIVSAYGGLDPSALKGIETIRELPEWGSEVEAQMSEWTADLDAESLAIHGDLANASFRTLSDN